MNAATRLAAYAGALALLFGAAWGAGAVTSTAAPGVPTPAPDAHSGTDRSATDHMNHGGTAHGDMDMSGDAGNDVNPDVGTTGLAMSAQGWTLTPATTTFAPGVAANLAFSVIDATGHPVTAFPAAPRIAVVRRDGGDFQQLDPVLAPDGSWHAPLTLPAPGVYRAVADLGGAALGADLFAPGEFVPLAAVPSRAADVDGFQVRLDGDLVPHEPSQVFATISRAGAPVTGLEPLDGGFGQLVTLRMGDLAYGVARPGDGAAPAPPPAARSGPAVAFTTIVPSAGTYRLYLRFRESGTVHTAAFTLATRSVP